MTPEIFKTLPIMEKVEEVELRWKLGQDNSKIKDDLGLSRHDLSHMKRLSERLTPLTRDRIAKNGLSEGHARALARVKDKVQEQILGEALARKWSVRKLEEAVKAYLANREPPKDAAYYKQLSEHISQTIGHPVKVQPNKTKPSKGEIVITYLDLDAFDSVMDRLRVKISDEQL